MNDTTITLEATDHPEATATLTQEEREAVLKALADEAEAVDPDHT